MATFVTTNGKRFVHVNIAGFVFYLKENDARATSEELAQLFASEDEQRRAFDAGEVGLPDEPAPLQPWVGEPNAR